MYPAVMIRGTREKLKETKAKKRPGEPKQISGINRNINEKEEGKT